MASNLLTDGRGRRPTVAQRLRRSERIAGAIHDMHHCRFRVVLQSVEKNSKNLEGFTEPLGRNGEEIANSIVEAVDGLDKLVEEFTVLSQSLNNRDGTLGKLINDPQLYENANRTICNANQVVLQVNDLTKRLRVVAEDARVFMDKVARAPGRVVTGGLNPSPIK
jgi:phospholipid/cholesterol/gamma-HCH transport system substrate-binding protein